MADTEAISFEADPTMLSTIVIGELMEVWAPTPVLILVPHSALPAHLDAVARVARDYDPKIVWYQDTEGTNMVYIARQGIMPTLSSVVLT